MKPLSGLDSLFLHLETAATPMHVGSLHLYELPRGYAGDFHADLERHLERRMPLVPLFRRRLRTLPLAIANPGWEDDVDVDLDAHVRRVRLPRPGTQAQLEACAARLHAAPLDRSRPLWEMHVIEGLATGEIGVYMKIHHAVLDGAAGVALSDVLLDRTPVARQVAAPARENRAPSRAAGFGDLAGAVLRHDVAQYARLVKHLPALAGTLAGIVRGARGPTAAPARRNLALAPRTPLNVSIAGERSFAAVSLSLAEAKGVARAHDATLNDVVLALCSGALRAWLARHGGIPREPLVAGMPLSVREPGNADYSSQVTMTLVNLATEIADPRARLVAIRDAAAAVKSTARRVKSLIPTDTPSLGAPWVLGGLAALYGRARLADTLPPIMNLVISNVPGPREPLYAAGARMRTYWPLSIVEHGVGLNITVVSYCDALDFGLVAATAAVPSVRPIARALEAAHAELVALTRAREPRTARGATATAAPRRRGGARQGRNRG